MQTFAPTEIFIVREVRSRDLSPRICRKSCDPNAAISSVTYTFKDPVKQSFKIVDLGKHIILLN